MTDKNIDPFKAAFAEMDKLKKQKEEASKNNSYNPDFAFEEREYLGLNPNEYKVLRILSNPVSDVRKPTDAKVILESRILKDNGKGYIYVRWPWKINSKGYHTADPDWFLSKVFSAVNKGKYVKYTEADVDGQNIVKTPEGTIIKSGTTKTGRWVHDNVNKPSFNRIHTNQKDGDKYPPSAEPQSRVVMTAIDRIKGDNVPRILTTRADEVSYPQEDGTTKKITWVNDHGISYGMYEDIMKKVSYRGNWYMDIILKRYKGSKWTFEFLDVNDIKSGKVPAELQGYLVDDPNLEKANPYPDIKLYDFDVLYQETSYSKIKNNLSALIKQVDLDCGTNFTEELANLVKVEEEKRAIENEKKEASKPVENKVVAEPVVEKPVARTPRMEKPIETSELSIEDQLKAWLPKWGSLEDEDVADMLANTEQVKHPEHGILYNVEIQTTPCDDENCKFPGTDIRTVLPNTVLICPVCAKNFS